MLGNKWLILTWCVNNVDVLTYSMLLQTKKTHITHSCIFLKYIKNNLLFHYANNIETPKFLLYLGHSIFTMPYEHTTKDVALFLW